MTIHITRTIGIDAGHRVPSHGGKCRSMHGHRYEIQATFAADELQGSGAAEGMVADFSFVKDLMMKVIDTHCDHKTILHFGDPFLTAYLKGPDAMGLLDWRVVVEQGVFESDAESPAIPSIDERVSQAGLKDRGYYVNPVIYRRHVVSKVTAECVEAVDLVGFLGTGIYAVNFIPTAENLARHWAQRLDTALQHADTGAPKGAVRLECIRVYETPNCWADYKLPRDWFKAR